MHIEKKYSSEFKSLVVMQQRFERAYKAKRKAQQEKSRQAMRDRRDAVKRPSKNSLTTVQMRALLFAVLGGGLKRDRSIDHNAWYPRKFPDFQQLAKNQRKVSITHGTVSLLAKNKLLYIGGKDVATITEEGKIAYDNICLTRDLYKVARATRSVCERLGIRPKNGWVSE